MEIFSSIKASEDHHPASEDHHPMEISFSFSANPDTNQGEDNIGSGETKMKRKKKKKVKKHRRPKIAQDFPKAKTPKPVTPKQPQEAKRRRSREKKSPNSPKTPLELDAAEEQMGREGADTVHQQPTWFRSARRSLNFDGQDRAITQNQSGLQVPVDNSDGSRSLNQMLDDYTKLPESTTSARPSRRELVRMNSNQLALRRDVQSRSSENQIVSGQPSRREIIMRSMKGFVQGPPDSDNHSHSMEVDAEFEKKGAKRKCIEVDDIRSCCNGGDPRAIDTDKRCGKRDLFPHFPESHKKRRTKRGRARTVAFSPIVQILVRSPASIALIMKCRQLLLTPLKPISPDIHGMQVDIIDQAKNALNPFENDGMLVPYKGEQAHNVPIAYGKDVALVPYKKDKKVNDGALVPYKKGKKEKDGALVPYKKGKKAILAKVDLDPESNRMWNVLMGKESDDTDADKEKWWDEQRQLFHDRAKIFITVMGFVQGPKRFSRWKGSVVDSVVGVFLTQNVADHMSSSAYMSLAARFPIHPKDKYSEPHAEKMNTPTEERDGSIFNVPKRQEDSLYPEVCSQEKKQQCEMQSTCSDSCQTFEVAIEVESNLKDENDRPQVSKITKGTTRKKAAKTPAKHEVVDWDILRKEVGCNGEEQERSNDTLDSLDWEALRRSSVEEVAAAIEGRGQHKQLGERIKNFIDRLVKDHGSINLEWLRNAPPDKVKDYLLSINGLGLKSVECVRLLALNQHAFPVDTNVGRICVRLGWVPLQPLPGSLQLHLLDEYPVMDNIQKYLWPRLCNLDTDTLYELHYQMITFGKVFCTKKRPNCNACPMKGDCKYFKSEFHSTCRMLTGPKEKNLESSIVPTTTSSYGVVLNSIPVAQLEGIQFTHQERVYSDCWPIIEEPKSPEPESIGTLELDIEDLFSDDLNGVIHMGTNSRDRGLSNAIIPITTQAASIPTSKLKNAFSLRTEHQVYELPDTHVLIKNVDPRDPDDPCPYLLVIWRPGETAMSTQPSKTYCNFEATGKLCDNNICYACRNLQEVNAQTVRGTLLIPCRTAMRGSFPLNGTYFQVNEVFADHESSWKPFDIPRELIWKLTRRTVYFGKATSSIFKGLTQEAIQRCFLEGYVCIRGFDRRTRIPTWLTPRLHEIAPKPTKKKIARTKKK